MASGWLPSNTTGISMTPVGLIKVANLMASPGTSQYEIEQVVKKSLEEMRFIDEGLRRVRHEIQSHYIILYERIPRDTRDIIWNLEQAMIMVLKIAVLVRGDYKTDWNDNAPIRRLIKNAKRSFDRIESDAKESLQQITNTRSIIVDLQTNKLGLFKRQMETLAETIKTYVEGAEKQYNTMKTSVETLERTQAQNRESVRVLQEKLQDYARQRMMIDATLIINPVAWLIAKGIDEGILKTRQNYDTVRRSVDEANATIRIIQSQVSDLSAQRSQIKSQTYALQEVQKNLPLIEGELKQAQLQASMFQTTMTSLQTTGTTLGRQIMAILPPIGTTDELAYTKDQIVLGLMQVSATAMFDISLEDECYLVANELATGYGKKPLPEETGKIFDGIKKRIRSFSPESGMIPFSAEALEVLKR